MSTNGANPPFRYTHDIDLVDGGPRRADVADLGGDSHEDEDPAPQIGIEPTASVTNEQNRHIVALERVGAICKLWVEFHNVSSVLTPVIVNVKAMGTLVEIASFTLTHPSPGEVNIFWEDGTLAPQESDPETSATSQVGIFGKIHPSPPSGSAGVQVKMWDTPTNNGDDGDFIVAIH